MRRAWPAELRSLLDDAEEVMLDVPVSERAGRGRPEETHRPALRVRVTQEDYQRIWPLAEARYRLDGKYAGKAVTLITNNPHYHAWHPADGGTVEATSDSGARYTIKYVVVHLLLDDVREEATAG
ncbi:hypothetical protein [Pseudorhizobium pelagicum]|uniref:Uncharacterized protein n=1 Tax=Pseudorhizobium pelagicum TaxID=1509405 RepID=A0A922P5J4_9HYPH|nr:hypothetical protein [Pseudorhizobium pelagicum]KEQ08817.1 hypothetical protein GV67_09840 [Pseudorhizobium pelagicum]KEQ09806.1 hypothetical protein GV68_20855 [Pseudorhizobium pelagicum]